MQTPNTRSQPDRLEMAQIETCYFSRVRARAIDNVLNRLSEIVGTGEFVCIMVKLRPRLPGARDGVKRSSRCSSRLGVGTERMTHDHCDDEDVKIRVTEIPPGFPRVKPAL